MPSYDTIILYLLCALMPSLFQDYSLQLLLLLNHLSAALPLHISALLSYNLPPRPAHAHTYSQYYSSPLVLLNYLSAALLLHISALLSYNLPPRPAHGDTYKQDYTSQLLSTSGYHPDLHKIDSAKSLSYFDHYRVMLHTCT